ncbi:leucine aminopeptidase 2, chloroplastic isoform X1 [Gossypium hirsutum]|uniref:Leucine aminopeptidase 2, chloroplastic isoform X1 n=1 Tax=Gossypium hirsutum TaxID=3635 RepID=A0A1U8NH89_GOSHI|nr:leucine aminopeptidase 2, chloroplastic-like isoform X1 [Gossypium hirsutum]
MISGKGMRPGDIVTASNGKTIEIVDLATLTGACVVALGPSIAVFSLFIVGSKGVFTPNDDLAKELFQASEVSGEKFWRMPLEESYWESMKSGVADMVNTGGRQGGAINAALFLKQFVDEKVKVDAR